MSETAAPAPPPAPRPAAAWGARLRWFAAEFLVVVAGVLVALAVNAWWAAEEDASREAAYLRQLDTDLAETERLLADFDAYFGPIDSTGALLVRAFRTPGRVSQDSVLRWLVDGTNAGEPRPVLGTAEALVTTGDLALIESDSLRSEVLAYLDFNRALLDTQSAVIALWRSAYLEVAERVDITDVVLQTDPDALVRNAADPYFEAPPDPELRPFPVDVEALLRDREAYRAFWTMNSAKRSMGRIRQQMAESAQTLREHVRAALADV